MRYRETMEALEALGTEQNRKVYARHGVGGPQFGVSYAELGKLKKRIGTDQTLASRLWASGNHDARVLATMIGDPASLSSADLDRWAKDLDDYVVADAFAKLVADSRHAKAKMKKWTRLASDEWRGRAGWMLLATLAMRDDEAVTERELAAYPRAVVARIHGAKNRVRDAMLSALAAIGMRGGDLEAEAVAATERIGPVEVDHGATACKTVDPVAMIAKAKGRKKKTAKKKTAEKKTAKKKAAKKKTAKKKAAKKKTAKKRLS